MKKVQSIIYLSTLLCSVLFFTACNKDDDGLTGPAKESLIAYYPFDNGSALDSGPHAMNGAINGAVPTEDRHGNENSAFHFNGSAYIECATEQLDINEEVTISAWISTSSSELQLIALKYTGGDEGSGFQIRLGENSNERPGEAACAGRDKNGTFKMSGYSGTDLSDDEWHLVTGVVEGQTWKIFVDGELKAVETYNDDYTALNANAAPIFIGGQPEWSNSFYFEGNIDELRIYNRALSDNEVKDLFNQ